MLRNKKNVYIVLGLVSMKGDALACLAKSIMLKKFSAGIRIFQADTDLSQ